MNLPKRRKPPTQQNPDFDVEKPEAVIYCSACSSPLWRIKVLKAGVSHEILPINKKIRHWSEKNQDCPVCHRPFYKMNGKEPEYLVRSTKTGRAFKL